VERLQTELPELERRLRAQLTHPDGRRIPVPDFVETRLLASRLASAATSLEVKLRGGRAYRLEDPSNRRYREAAFLSLQAPTEAQLERELTR
jgi:alkylation response protein AidB-like acyl-CoA dehydrogenase